MKVLTLIMAAFTTTLSAMPLESCSTRQQSMRQQETLSPSSRYITKKIDLRKISSIRSANEIKVEYTQTSGKVYAEIYAPQNIIPYVKVQQQGNNLEIDYDFPEDKQFSIQGKYTCEVKIFAPEVTSFSTSSWSSIKLVNGLKTNKNVSISTSSEGKVESEFIKCADFNARTSSDGVIDIKNAACEDLYLSTSSFGKINISTADCSSLDIHASSSGNCRLTDLICKGKANTESSSDGEIKVGSLKAKAMTAQASSISNIHLSGTCGNVKYQVSSGGNIYAKDMKVKDVDASASSGGNIHLSGTCGNAEYQVSSIGNVYAKEMKAKDVNTSASSGGNIQCYVTGTLSTHISSGGNVRYQGDPENITGKKQGLSRL